MDQTSKENIMAYMKDHLDEITFKTLRLNEVELTPEEKLTKMNQILDTDPGLFLSKWGNYLTQDVLKLFKSIEGNYEVDYLLDSLLYQEPMDEGNETAWMTTNIFENRRPRKPKSALNILTRNRRYEYLKHHLRHSDYFSEESMQLREPVLYDQFIGQHIPIKEKQQPFSNTTGLVDRILSNIDRKYVSDHLERQKIRDEEQFEEEEEESEDEEEDDAISNQRSTPALISKSKQKDVKMKEIELEENSKMEEKMEENKEEEEDEEENMAELAEFREEQRLELLQLLEEKFLAGKDETFDYSTVDYNDAYDDLQQQEQDIQDKYFDED